MVTTLLMEDQALIMEGVVEDVVTPRQPLVVMDIKVLLL
jgi:hypothetical protein